jgi:dephospho-CoA kinase
MEKAIAICGHICAGKTAVTTFLTETYHWNVVSFGNYVKHVAQLRGLPATRRVYQELGQQLFEESGPTEFLEAVISFDQPSSKVHLYDSIRHPAIVSEVRNKYAQTAIIYLDTNAEKRYDRYLARQAPQDPKLTFENFLQLSQQPVERGISEIGASADLVIDGALSFEAVIQLLDCTIKTFTDPIS